MSTPWSHILSYWKLNFLSLFRLTWSTVVAFLRIRFIWLGVSVRLVWKKFKPVQVQHKSCTFFESCYWRLPQRMSPSLPEWNPFVAPWYAPPQSLLYSTDISQQQGNHHSLQLAAVKEKGWNGLSVHETLVCNISIGCAVACNGNRLQPSMYHVISKHDSYVCKLLFGT